MWILYFLSIAFSTPTPQNLSEKKILEHVLSQFPSVRMAQNDLAIASGEQRAANGAFDVLLQGQYIENTGDYENDFFNTRIVKPTSLFGLDLYGGFRKGDGNFAFYDEEFRTLNQGEWNVGLRLPLLRDFLIDERRARLQKSDLNVDQRKYQLQSTEIDQVRLALHRYWDWVLAGKRVLIQKSLLTTAEQRDTWLQKRTKAGDLPRFERNDNLRSILQRTSAVLQSEQNLEQAIAELQFYLDGADFLHQLNQLQSIPEDYKPLTTNPLTTQNAEKLTQLAMQQRPDLKAVLMQIEQNRVDERFQDNRLWPKLDIQAQYSKDEGVGSTSLDDDNFKTMVTVEIPLQYRAIRGRQAQIRGQTQKLMNQKQLLQQRITADIRVIKKNFEVSMQRRNLAKQELTLAQMLEKGERTRLSHGETNVLTVNLREQATAEAELRLAESSVEAIKHLINLKAAVGEIPALN